MSEASFVLSVNYEKVFTRIKKRQIKKSQLLSKQNSFKILTRDIPIILAHGYFEMSTKYKFIRIKSGKIITYENF